MNRPFWSLSRPARSQDCEEIESLLSLYADGAASPAETRCVEAHLPGCPGCAATLALIRATHLTLAARPVMAPPADLHTRIAQAIAASSAAPVSLRPSRSFILRPAYAAAASVSVLGLVLSYSLLHAPSEVVVKPLPNPSYIASLPVSVAKSHAQAQIPHRTAPKRSRPLVATTEPNAYQPGIVQPLPILRTPAPVSHHAPRDRVAENVTPPVVHPVPVRSPIHALPVHDRLASGKIIPVEKRLPLAPKEMPRPAQSPLMADRVKPTAPVPVNILPPTVTPQPDVKTTLASSTTDAKLGDILGTVRAHVSQMQHASLVTSHQSYRGAENVMRTLAVDTDAEHFGYVDMVHSK